MADDLMTAFRKTPEMIEHAQFFETVNRDVYGATQSITLEIPKAFLAMLEFQEWNNAKAAGRIPALPEKVLQGIVMNELHDQLHWHSVDPLHYPYYRSLWNRFCDENEAPERKIKSDQAQQERGGEGPF